MLRCGILVVVIPDFMNGYHRGYRDTKQEYGFPDPLTIFEFTCKKFYHCNRGRMDFRSCRFINIIVIFRPFSMPIGGSHGAGSAWKIRPHTKCPRAL